MWFSLFGGKNLQANVWLLPVSWSPGRTLFFACCSNQEIHFHRLSTMKNTYPLKCINLLIYFLIGFWEAFCTFSFCMVGSSFRKIIMCIFWGFAFHNLSPEKLVFSKAILELEKIQRVCSLGYSLESLQLCTLYFS